MKLSEAQKHRVIYKFFPDLRGHWLEDERLDEFYSDSVNRALRQGWSEGEIETAAISGKWRKLVRTAPAPEH